MLANRTIANATGTGGWEDALARARVFLAQLTLEEKADMVTGQPGPCVGNIVAIPRLGFGGLCLQDGPLAIRVADYASVFAAGVSAAATWDKGILYERGVAMGQEFRAKGAHVALTPVCGPLGRSAYSGRNWEGFSPDPYLTGIAMERSITGLQDAGVQATAKHYIGNEQETQRNPTYDPNGTVTDISFEALSSNMDDRTMHGKCHDTNHLSQYRTNCTFSPRRALSLAVCRCRPREGCKRHVCVSTSEWILCM
jgi:beta-glucosidase